MSAEVRLCRSDAFGCTPRSIGSSGLGRNARAVPWRSLATCSGSTVSSASGMSVLRPIHSSALSPHCFSVAATAQASWSCTHTLRWGERQTRRGLTPERAIVPSRASWVPAPGLADRLPDTQTVGPGASGEGVGCPERPDVPRPGWSPGPLTLPVPPLGTWGWLVLPPWRLNVAMWLLSGATRVTPRSSIKG